MAIKRDFILSSGIGISANDLYIVGSTASTSKTNGALTVSGGVGIGGSLSVGSYLLVEGQFGTISKTHQSYSATYYYYLGSGKNTSWPNAGNMTLSGNISNFMFYNRALSATEVLQNYNATKGRYR
jgi:hypothetical protein